MAEMDPQAADGGGESGNATQLSDRFPQIDTPLRVDPPLALNAPDRVESREMADRSVRLAATIPLSASTGQNPLNGSANAKAGATTAGAGGPGGERGTSEATVRSLLEHNANARSTAKDFDMLALSSKRAGNLSMEASSTFSIAVVADNMGEHQKALAQYQKYLKVTQRTNDIVGQAVALNCIGVNNMLLARPLSDTGFLEGVDVSDDESAVARLRKAIEAHQQHADIADAGGQFVAHSNLGLCKAMLHEYDGAARDHQEALRIALRMQSTYGQSIAVGNLGLLALKHDDYSISQSCLEQHLQLVQSLGDTNAEVNGWRLIARLASAQGNFERAVTCLEQGRELAAACGYINVLKRLNCSLGIAKGQMQLSEYMQDLIYTADTAAEEADGGSDSAVNADTG